MADLIHEAIVNGDEIGTYDPVTAIIIVTEFGSWELSAAELQTLLVREKKS